MAEVVYSSKNQPMEVSLVDTLEESSAETHGKFIGTFVFSIQHRGDFLYRVTLTKNLEKEESRLLKSWFKMAPSPILNFDFVFFF